MKRWAVVLAGCALTSKAAPLDLRYFDPPARALVAVRVDTPRVPLRVGRVVTSSILGSRIVHRDSAVEVTPYETLRWSEEPEVYVRRALVRALFDGGAFEQATDGTARTLDVDVIAFEEVRRGPERLGRVELRYDVRDNKRVLLHGTVAIDREATANIDGVVAAIGSALDAASAELAQQIVSASRRSPRPEAPQQQSAR